ncbi:hypothetical protein [Neisseria sp. CCUG12390]|uniref:hypothetical protein n=1 Tax=Neisseria sp. CCUG12390 TaxID=3392035 RepID=UPI003A0FBFF1
MKPTVILAVPYLYGLDRCIEKNLRFHGFEVINLCFDDRDVHYPDALSRLKNLYHKHITRDGDYRKQLRFLPYRKQIAHQLAALGGNKADYALCIRANIYPKEIIAKIRAQSKICVNYQWDGIDRFPDILEYLGYFDRFFVFDQSDAARYPQYGFQTASNFYFDYPLPESGIEPHGLYFLGGYDPTRETAMQTFIAQAGRLKLPLDFHIYSKDGRARRAFGNEGIRYLDRGTVLGFEDNIEKIGRCATVVDFVTADHQGLSFRVFDAMRYRKKLITTNRHIFRYDFYRPDNILVWNPNISDTELTAFLQTPYQALPPETEEKYSFGNWLRYLFDIRPHQPINLPHTQD